MHVCYCCQYNDEEVRRLFRSHGLQGTINLIKESKGCFICIPYIKQMYQEGEALDYVKKANDIGQLVAEKNKAYGDSFGEASKILEVLWITILLERNKLMKVNNYKTIR